MVLGPPVHPPGFAFSLFFVSFLGFSPVVFHNGKTMASTTVFWPSLPRVLLRGSLDVPTATSS